MGASPPARDGDGFARTIVAAAASEHLARVSDRFLRCFTRDSESVPGGIIRLQRRSSMAGNGEDRGALRPAAFRILNVQFAERAVQSVTSTVTRHGNPPGTPGIGRGFSEDATFAGDVDPGLRPRRMVPRGADARTTSRHQTPGVPVESLRSPRSLYGRTPPPTSGLDSMAPRSAALPGRRSSFDRRHAWK